MEVVRPTASVVGDEVQCPHYNHLHSILRARRSKPMRKARFTRHSQAPKKVQRLLEQVKFATPAITQRTPFSTRCFSVHNSVQRMMIKMEVKHQKPTPWIALGLS